MNNNQGYTTNSGLTFGNYTTIPKKNIFDKSVSSGETKSEPVIENVTEEQINDVEIIEDSKQNVEVSNKQTEEIEKIIIDSEPNNGELEEPLIIKTKQEENIEYSEVKCSNCGSIMNDRFCENCGTERTENTSEQIINMEEENIEVKSNITDKIICPSCGSKIVSGSLFCEDCGTKL